MLNLKKGVLFVGSFVIEAKDGHVGGQMYACKSLLSSSLNDQYEWFLLDSTSISVVPPPVYIRTWKAFLRICKFTFLLITKFKRIDTALIFCGDGFSLIEKGVMVLIARLFNKKAIIAPRSGLILNDFKKPWLKSYIRFIFDKSDCVICQGAKWKGIFANKLNLSNHKLLIINNWIDYGQYAKSSKPLGSSQTLTITYIGWLEIFKGTRDLFSVIERINSDFQDRVEFRIAGMGSDFHYLGDIIKVKGWSNVKLLGWIKGEGKMDLLKQTDIYVQMSHFEGFPNSLLEAMAAGKAVISTDVGAVSDLIQTDVNGFICDVGDIDAAVKSIKAYICSENLRTEFSDRARITVVENFSLEQAVSKFVEIL